MEFKSENYGIKKIEGARNDGFILSEKVNLTIKIYSDLSGMNISYYVNFSIPIMHRQLFRIISQSREYIKTHCNDLYNPFQFAHRDGCLDDQSSKKLYVILII